ncbi:C-type lectin domain family 2 member D-like [Chelydra serpentina]|uniref:C-type lectin domain family 2 member D-like n=1 Tax=Chelydra serpentina TaxID=8475 RepID=A0A8T1S3V3_CHESE|nr:C-type lectin domain family 2 member D-like [Chelydra serpentina]
METLAIQHQHLDPEKQESAEKLIWLETQSTKSPIQREESIPYRDQEVPVCTCGKGIGLKILSGIAGLTVVITLIVLAVLTTKSLVTSSPSPAASSPVSWPGPSCPDGWIGYRGKCYSFSEMEGNWSSSQSQCSALNASLAVIDSEQDLNFMLRFKVRTDPWIGLRREPGQGWKWPNGLEFNNSFVIRGESDCAFLSDDTVSSSRCYIERNWICSKPDAYAKGTDSRV